MKFKELNCVDATEDLELKLLECHILGATTKSTSQRLRRECAIVLAGMDSGIIDDIVVDRNIVKVLFKGNTVWTRYQSTPTARAIIQANDRAIAKKLHSLGVLTFPEEGLTLRFKVPRKAVSLEHLRSAKMKAIRRASAEKRKGQPKRSHQAPDALTLQGIRNGSRLGL